MSEIGQFSKQARKIHDVHIEQLKSTDIEIAEKRIRQYFDGKLNLGWKSILYEINKLPELHRNTYFKKLVEKEIAYNNTLSIMKERKDSIEAIIQWSIWTFIREKRKAIKNNYVKMMETQIKNFERKN